MTEQTEFSPSDICAPVDGRGEDSFQVQTLSQFKHILLYLIGDVSRILGCLVCEGMQMPEEETHLHQLTKFVSITSLCLNLSILHILTSYDSGGWWNF